MCVHPVGKTSVSGMSMSVTVETILKWAYCSLLGEAQTNTERHTMHLNAFRVQLVTVVELVVDVEWTDRALHMTIALLYRPNSDLRVRVVVAPSSNRISTGIAEQWLGLCMYMAANKITVACFLLHPAARDKRCR